MCWLRRLLCSLLCVRVLISAPVCAVHPLLHSLLLSRCLRIQTFGLFRPHRTFKPFVRFRTCLCKRFDIASGALLDCRVAMSTTQRCARFYAKRFAVPFSTCIALPRIIGILAKQGYSLFATHFAFPAGQVVDWQDGTFRPTRFALFPARCRRYADGIPICRLGRKKCCWRLLTTFASLVTGLRRGLKAWRQTVNDL